MRVCDLDTPALILDLNQLEANLKDMSSFAKMQHLKLCPHVKAHKIPEIALRQLAGGAVGITVAKLGEAEVMAEAGIEDILIAYPIVGANKLARFIKLATKVKLRTVVDNLEQARALGAACAKAGLTIPVLVEIDTGLKRCGLAPDAKISDFVEQLLGISGLTFKGLLTHAGHVYGAKDLAQVQEIGVFEGTELVKSAEVLRSSGFTVEEISVGSTPTAKLAGKVAGVTEIRPGNYVFYDAIQVGLGVAKLEQCALKVLSTVVSRPTGDRAIIDAGSKTLALDRGAHGNALVAGFGILPDIKGWELTRLSEEHGILEASSGAVSLSLGQKLTIIPNHACPVLNLAKEVYVCKGEQVVDIWEVKAGGAVR